MIKMIYLLKRREGMTREEFIAQYESGHARLGEKYAPHASRYVRRYLEPLPELFTGNVIEPEHDVITELWFDTEEDYAASMAILARPDVMAEIVADEETLFKRSKHRLFRVNEHDSVVSAKGVKA